MFLGAIAFHFRCFFSTPHESENFITSTVTATLSSSATGNTICSGDEIAFTASPDDADQYKFYVNGILKQGPSTDNIFKPDFKIYDDDRIIVILEKNGITGSSSLTIIENKIEDAGKIFFRGKSDALSQITVCYGTNSLNLDSYRSAKVNGAELTTTDSRYQWMSSSDNIKWDPIVGANQRGFIPIRLTSTSFFRRDVINELNGTTCRASTNILFVEVEEELKGGVVSPATQILCENEISKELKIENGVKGKTVTYQWQISSDNVVFHNILSKANSKSYFPGTVTQTTYFRRLTNAVNGTCTPGSSSVHKIEILKLDAGVFDPAYSTTICYGETPLEFSTAPLKLGQPGRGANSENGLLKFQWEMSTNKGNTWQQINNATQRNYSSPALTASTWFRRKVTAELNGQKCEAFSGNIIKIDVLPPIDRGSLHANQEICVGEVPKGLQLRNFTEVPGTNYSFQWQKSAGSYPFEYMAGQIGKDLNFTKGDSWIPKETTRYRVKISDTSHPQCAAVFSDVVTITVRPLQKILQVGGPVDSQTICFGDNMTPLVLQFDGSASDLDLSDVVNKGLTVTPNRVEKKYTISGSVRATTVLNIKSRGSYCNPDLLEYKIEVRSSLVNTVPYFIYATEGVLLADPETTIERSGTFSLLR